MADNEDKDKGPLPGTWAFTARAMAEIMPEFDWDAWKDEMKERDLYEDND